MTKKTDISDRIRSLRKSRGLFQKEVAEVLCVGRVAYANKEVGKTQFSITELALLADYYDVSVEWILSGKNDKKKDFLTEEEARLINTFRNLNAGQKHGLIMAAVDLMLAKDK